jgi:glycosyltransferase involved in cell wall biosynthesis
VKLTVTVITRDEAANIAAALQSVSWADEIIVVDSHSTDDTVAIARGLATRVVSRDWPGYSGQKNYAAEIASNDWILSIDADERVPPELAQEIRQAIAGGAADCYELPRRSSFCGRLMDHSGWSPDYVLRLFRRDKAYFSADLVHERVVCSGKPLRLDEPLMHDPVRRLEDALSRMDRYSTAGAEQLIAAGRRVSFASGISHGLWTFFRTYLLRAGFLDGREGFLLAVANAEGTYYRYMKAWLRSRNR